MNTKKQPLIAADLTEPEEKRLTMFFHLLWKIDRRVNKEKRQEIQRLVNTLDLYVLQQLKKTGLLANMIYDHDTEHAQSTRRVQN